MACSSTVFTCGDVRGKRPLEIFWMRRLSLVRLLSPLYTLSLFHRQKRLQLMTLCVLLCHTRVHAIRPEFVRGSL